jgi:class 3 adenylate cyclase/AcrR family transcriptional regulator
VAITENVTVVFTDLVGSTELASSLTPDAGDEVRRRHFSALRQAIAATGGTEVKNLGDGLMVVFPVASAALGCAVAMQQAVHRDNGEAERPLGLRVGLSAGEATKEDGDYFGDPIVEAARLCARAEGGQILVADVVRAMAGRRSPHDFTSLGELDLKGLPDPVQTLEVGWEPLMQDSIWSGGLPLPASIVAEAWRLAREHGVGGISLRALASAIGMRQPSLYKYFDSKHALYDAMFADGNRQLLERLEALKLPTDPRAALKKYLATFVAFAVEDPARYELLFQRHLPGFTPSPESYALAEDALGRLVKQLSEAGVTDQGDIDCIVAITAGLMEAQMSNDPAGDRWTRHLNRLVDLFIDDAIDRSKHR